MSNRRSFCAILGRHDTALAQADKLSVRTHHHSMLTLIHTDPIRTAKMLLIHVDIKLLSSFTSACADG
jgi:hypothetical protein